MAPLSKERVLQAAVALADQGGIESLSMRKLAQELGVEAMSLYNHVRNKDDILDGIVDVIVSEIGACEPGPDWKTTLRRRVISARQVLLRHRWAPPVIASRSTMSPATVDYMESIIRVLRTGGFTVDQTHHALHVLGSRVLGFTQELFDDTSQLDTSPEMAAIMAQEMAERYPYVTEMAISVSHDGGLGGCDDEFEFAFGLDLILDGLERSRDGHVASSTRKPRQPVGDAASRPGQVDPLVARAIEDLRGAALHADGNGTPDASLVRQLRATFLELFDSVLEDPQRRASRRAALTRRAGRRSAPR